MKVQRFVLTILLSLMVACSATTTPTQDSTLGTIATMADMQKVINTSGPLIFKKHIAANWQVPLSGLLNLDHPKAIAAGLTDRDENIQIFVYSITHPIFGTYIIDSGVSSNFTKEGGNPDISFLVDKAMQISLMEVLLTTKQLSEKLGGIDGVFLSHIHMDHIMGLTDLNNDVPIFIGPNGASLTTITHAVTQGSTNRLLANTNVLYEWQFSDEGIIDVFGDGSLWAIHSPGHTPGSTAYLARTTNGSELMIGDATHTRWGWDNAVEPGSYSEDGPLSAISLAKLLNLAEQNPKLNVHPGHQD